MPYVNVELDDLLPEIDTKDLIEELESRKEYNHSSNAYAWKFHDLIKTGREDLLQEEIKNFIYDSIGRIV